MTDIKKLNYELSSISRYAGLLYSKYTLLILLAIIYYPMRITPAYIFIAAILTPVVPRIVSASQQPAKDQKDNFTLAYTAGRYHFTTENYKYEKFGSSFTLILLLLWHIKVYYHSTYSLPCKERDPFRHPADNFHNFFENFHLLQMTSEYRIRKKAGSPLRTDR